MIQYITCIQGVYTLVTAMFEVKMSASPAKQNNMYHKYKHCLDVIQNMYPQGQYSMTLLIIGNLESAYQQAAIRNTGGYNIIVHDIDTAYNLLSSILADPNSQLADILCNVESCRIDPGDPVYQNVMALTSYNTADRNFVHPLCNK